MRTDTDPYTAPTAMALARPPPDDSPSSEQFSTDKQPLLDTPERERQAQLPPPHSGLNWKSVPKLGFALILAVFYVGFCFIVQYRVVPIGGSGGLGLPFVHFSTESGITTVAILIVYVALWPIKGVLDEIRSEEFFRLLRTHPNGVPLNSVNAVSAPTNGAFNIFLATIHRHCSPLLTSTLAITLIITATSSLAPAALNTHSIWIDVDDPIFQVGAVTDAPIQYDAKVVFQAAAMSWVENTLNFTNAYHRVNTSSEDDPLGYIVPFPPGYNSTMQAYWTTDIVVFDPSCSWQTPNVTGVVDTQVFSNNLTSYQYYVWLSEYLYVALNIDDNLVSDKKWVPKLSAISPNGLVPDGSIIFVIAQNSQDSLLPPVTNMSALPTLQFSDGNVLAFLLCFPQASIQTRQVRTPGNGILTLGQTQQQRQGNLDLNQVQPTVLSKVGQICWLSSLPNIAPLANITAVYKLAIQSAIKTLLSGAVATANVPGGSSVQQLVFSSSLGHVIASAIFFTILMITLVAAQYRKGRDAFTLIHVAAALEGSDMPKECMQIRQSSGRGDGNKVRLVLNEVGTIVFIKSETDESVST